jgi:hypothetical protein
MSKLYKNSFELHGVYKDGAFAKEKGAAITTNPFPIALGNPGNAHFAWIDGWNKTSFEKTPVRYDGQFSTAVTATAPPIGQVGLNNAVFASATQLRAALRTLGGVDITQNLIDLPVGTTIRLINSVDETNFYQCTTTGAGLVTTYATFNTSFGTSAGTTFADSLALVIQISRP